MYYLQSRYYDSAIGRFINADIPEILGLDFENLAQYDLFAYCFNNPGNMADELGSWPKWVKKVVKAVAKVATQVKAVLSIPSTVVKIAVASTVAVVSGEATVKDVWNDLTNYSFFNTDEEKCINAKVFSSYNGTPVIKHNINGGSMSIFNTIFLSNEDRDVETVKHEWGHTVQQTVMGTPKFLIRIGIPSLIGAAMNVDDYYSQPWERSADFFGGATHDYSEGSDFWAAVYFVMP